MAADLRIPRDLRGELGRTGVLALGGYVYEEALRELQLWNGQRIYREMADGNAIIGGTLLAIEQIVRKVEWSVEPAGKRAADDDAAQFVDEALGDMAVTWQDTLSEILSMLTFGWSWCEQVYKYRDGDSDDPERASKYDDGKIGWASWSIRAQETLLRWEFDEAGGLLGLWQLPPPDYRLRFIPIDKSLHFKTTSRKGNPEGLSILRRAYQSWYYVQNIQRIEAIGIERDLAGLPVAKIPASVMEGPDQAQYQAYKDLVTNLRNDEQAGVVIPSDVDPDSHQPLYELQLLSTGGSRQIEVDPVIARYDRRIAGALLADFMLLGQDKVGSFALAQPYSARVLTPTGFVTMGELQVGQRVSDPLGEPSRVAAIYEHGAREVYAVHFGDGRVVETADDHRWAVTTPYWQRQGVPKRPRRPWADAAPEPYDQLPRYGVLTTAQIKQRLESPGYSATFEVPPVRPIDYVPVDETLPIDPYVLGLVLGDGWTGPAQGVEAAVITTADAEIVSAVKELVPTARVKAKPDARTAVSVVLSTGYGPRNRYTRALRALGLRGRHAHDKFIPRPYQYASVVERIALLQGLMDSDGTCANGQNVYSTVSAQLADDVEFLARGLGATSVHRRVRHDGPRPVYVVDFDVAPGIIPFRLARKARRYQSKHATHGNRIVRVERTGRSEPMRCIAVTAPSHLYLTDGFVPTHNSHDKTALFQQAVSSLLDNIESVVNRFAIPRLLRLNGMPIDQGTPALRHAEVTTPDLDKLGAYVQALAAAKLNVAGIADGKWLLEQAGIPTLATLSGPDDPDTQSPAEQQAAAAQAQAQQQPMPTPGAPGDGQGGDAQDDDKEQPNGEAA